MCPSGTFALTRYHRTVPTGNAVTRAVNTERQTNIVEKKNMLAFYFAVEYQS